MRDRNEMDLEGRGRKDIREVEGGEIVIMIYSMKKESVSNIRKK